MTKKHFKAIAEVIKQITDQKERERVARLMANNLWQFNDRFNFTRFLKECGLNGTE